MGAHYYFAYGSNMHPLRMSKRDPDSTTRGRAYLQGYSLRLHKRGRDQSSKCDAWWTGRRQDVLHGVVYRIGRGALRRIDKAEDLGSGYNRIRVRASLGGRPLDVLTYQARPEAITRSMLPFDWYMGYVLVGGRHHGLPAGYLSALRRIRIQRDSNTARRLSNRSVLLQAQPNGSSWTLRARGVTHP